MNIKIRKLHKREYKEALLLVMDVFMKYEAPDYTPEGADTFRRSVLENEEYQNNLIMYGAFFNEKLIGVSATRNNGKHVALLFVDGEYHKNGIGRALVEKMSEKCENMTVNSSPYAVGFYHKMGFCDIDKEQCENGIRYTPMKLNKNGAGNNSNSLNENCPCVRKCLRHGNCILCRKHHIGKIAPSCDRLKVKQQSITEGKLL